MVRVMEILQWIGMDPSQYWLGIELYLRLLGVLYVIVYVPFLFQVRGLYGKNGIRPVELYLNHVRERLGRKAYYYIPSLWWLCAKDWALLALIWAGILFGVLLAFGVWVPVTLLVLYVIHLSLTTAGQDFMSFGWETLLMEFTVASALMTATEPYNVIGWIGLNFVFIRFMLQAGASKLLSRDPCWRDMTGCCYHYLTQPIPNMQSWFAHKLPRWFHQLSTLLMFWIELVIPLLFFAPDYVRLFCFFNFFVLLFVIWQTGNFSYLNQLTMVAALILIPNWALEPWMGAPPVVEEPSGWIWYGIVSALAAVFLFLQIINLWQYFFKERWIGMILMRVEPFHISQPHQLFSMMTKKRYEVVIEGSYDGMNWQEYLFWYKPSEVSRRPRRISPFQPRLDWQAWFLPFQSFQHQYWFHNFLSHLLKGTPEVTKLLRYNPFEEKPPVFVRVRLYDYTFTSWEELRKTGHWWNRRLVGEYAPPMRLNP